ncbi:MAG: riboflavin biosynthesis protein RibD, partial [Pseudomonadota bacterium]
IIARAATQDGGRPHAEETALSTLAQDAAKGGTAYVTLEPCQQRSNGNESCSTLLIASGISRVVYAIADPHPQGEGGGDRLIAAGVVVEEGLMREEAAELYKDFFASI